jgi:ABC-type nitrate/sulfonate/bicarbonate transport system substrate-binding protein
LEVPTVSLPGTSVLAAFAGGEIDVSLTTDPLANHVAERGAARKWKNLTEVVPGLQLGVIAYGPKLLRNRELGTRFMRAYLRGVAQYREGKTPRNIEIASAFTGLTPEVIESSCWTFIEENGALSPATIDTYLEWAVERGYIDGLVDVSDYHDPEFVEKAASQLGAN